MVETIPPYGPLLIHLFVPAAEVTAVPVSGISRVGLLAPFETTCRAAVFTPDDVGAKVTDTVQLPPTAIVGVRLEQGFQGPDVMLNWLLSGPVIPRGVLMTRGCEPMFMMPNTPMPMMPPPDVVSLTETMPKFSEAGVTEI
jgi:hypothetical protein